MSKKEKPFKPPKHRQPFFALVKKFLPPFYKRPKLINLNEDIQEVAIFVSNHCARRGPVIMELYLPVRTAKWGTYQMLGDYKSRRQYMRDVFYRQKCGYGKFRSSFLATFTSFFSIFFYRGMKFLPTYPDARLSKTLNNSVEVLKDGTGILIFPEDSEEGYFNVMKKFFPGFVMLAENYFRKTKQDIPVYPVYYQQKANKLIVGQPEFVQKLKALGMKRDEIADRLCGKVNELYYKYIADCAVEN